MNLFYGKIVDVFEEDGTLAARLRVGGALKKISLAFVAEVEPGDTVLVCDGMAISRVEEKEEEKYVFGDSW